MTDPTPVEQILARVPADCERVVVLYPKDGQTACSWWGLSPEQVVVHLYAIADEIARQRLPPPGTT